MSFLACRDCHHVFPRSSNDTRYYCPECRYSRVGQATPEQVNTLISNEGARFITPEGEIAGPPSQG